MPKKSLSSTLNKLYTGVELIEPIPVRWLLATKRKAEAAGGSRAEVGVILSSSEIPLGAKVIA